MNSTERKIHWNKIYTEKQPNEMSWHQDVPLTSLDFVKEFNLPQTAEIFDNGGGDSHFVDCMLEMGYENITVLDISEAALQKTRQRLSGKANKIKWIIADEAKCDPKQQYDLWHDRAAFHFLTDYSEIQNYIQTVGKCIKPGGYLVMGTFSEEGPTKCSGMEIKQYSQEALVEALKENFEMLKCIKIDHVTPFNTVQNFLFCSFKKIS